MLTEIQCKNAQPKAKPYKIFDTNGLYLLINPTGSKLWRMKYSLNGKERLLSFGKYPTMSLKEARVERDIAREKIDKRVDPAEQKKEAKQQPSISADKTFRAVATAWMEGWASDKAEKTKADLINQLDRYVYPEIGDKHVDDLRAKDFVAIIKKIEARGIADTPRRVLQRCNLIMRFAVVHELAERNPVADVRPADILKPQKIVNQPRIDTMELPELLKKIQEYDGSMLTRFALRLMILTFVRTSELKNAKWSEIDWDAALWRIPGERMKMKVPHLVPLSRQTIELLTQLKELYGRGEYLFPGSQGAATISKNTILFALYRMGYHSRMTGHGFRGLASTILHEQGWKHEYIEAQLAHQEKDQVSAAYNHATYLSQRKEMMQAWADYLPWEA